MTLAANSTESAAIVSKIQAGDMQGLEDLHVKFGAMIKHLLLRRIGPDWEDLYTQVLYESFITIQRYGMRNSDALPGLVATIAKRSASNYIDDRARESSLEGLSDGAYGHMAPFLEKQLTSGQRTPEQEFVHNEKMRWISWGLQFLTEGDREIMRRFYLEGQPREQIEAEMNLTVTQLRLRKSRAKARLAEIIQKKMARRRRPENPDKTEFTGIVLAA